MENLIEGFILQEWAKAAVTNKTGKASMNPNKHGRCMGFVGALK
jgi:hypothetical protein